MVGYNAPGEVQLWVQLTAPGSVYIRYWPQDRPQETHDSPPLTATADQDLIVKPTLSGLTAGTRYGYAVWIDGQEAARTYPLAFQTQPLWRHHTPPPPLKVAFGSCHYDNDPPHDRPGPPWGDDFKIFDEISRAQPDLMLWLGDNIYLREADWTSPTGIAARHARTREMAYLQPLLGAIHHLAIWDDHDYGPNDADRTFPLQNTTRAVFQRYWANPPFDAYPPAQTPGIYAQFSWSDVDFFLLDNRTYRAPAVAPPGPDKPLLGDAQTQWLIDALTASRATFKVIVSGGQVLNPLEIHENWSRYPDERQRLLDTLRDRRISGVVFLSGDRHHSELIKLTLPGLYPLYDFTSSPLTAGIGDGDPDHPARVPNTLVRARSFGLLSFDGPKGARTLTMQAIDAEGAVLWEHTILANDLTPP
jgi:alkaline phosphatase D